MLQWPIGNVKTGPIRFIVNGQFVLIMIYSRLEF